MTYWIEIAGNEFNAPLLFAPIPAPDWAFSGRPETAGIFQNNHDIITGPCNSLYSGPLFISIRDDEQRVVPFMQLNNNIYNLGPGTFLRFDPGNLQVSVDVT